MKRIQKMVTWKIAAAIGTIALFLGNTADACTAFVVGKKASVTGHVIVGHNNDGFGPMRYALLPATDSAPALREIGRVDGLGGGKSSAIYWQAVYSDKAKVGKATGDVLLNEHGVIMFSNSGGFMREWDGQKAELPDEPTGETIDGGLGLALRFEVIRRAHSAAEGVKIATSLIDRYGYGPDARTFTIADRDEAWILCAVKGHRYVARRCPDDAVMAYPNILPVGKILPGDIVSPGIESKRDTFDFAAAYQGLRTKHDPTQKYRIIEFYRITAGVTVDEKELPWSAKPAHLVSVDDLKRGFSSHAVGNGRVSIHPEEVPGVPWPVCRLRTLESVICRFTAKPDETHISLAPGHPCDTKYDEFRPFKDALPAYFSTGAAAEKLYEGRLCNPSNPSDCGEINWNDKAVRQQAVLETAYAYYLKADSVQYGSAMLVARGGMEFCRRTKEGKPEDATPDNTYYTVCSSFTYETYFNAIGYRHSGKSETSVTIILTTRPQEAVVFEYDKRLDPDGTKFEPEMMRMRSLLEVGDIIVYSTIRGKDPKTGTILGGGHALLYVGDLAGDGHPMVMHSGGAKYDFATGIDQIEKSGTIRIDDMDGNFFLNGGISKQTKVMVFRPLDLPAEQYPLTESAKARYLHPRLRIDRCVDVGPYGSVVSGGELNYSITFKNFSKKAYTVPVRENVPEGCELVSYTALPTAVPHQLTTQNSQLSWNVPLAPGEERKLEWCVKVTAPAGNKVIASGGTAAGIPSNTLVTEVVPRRISAAVARAWAEANIHTVTNLPKCRVVGWGGGRQSREPSRDVRVRDPHARQLMEGDVVVVCPKLKYPKAFKLWVMGRKGLEEMTPNGIRWVTDEEVTALLAKDFFMALRPAAESNVEEILARQKAVVATAFAYHRKRELVQTAPTGATAESIGYVPKYGEPPEAAKPEHVIYQTPLSFVNDVYLNTVGRGFCDPSSTTISNLVENPPAGILMFSYDVRKDPGHKQYWTEMEKMWSIIEPGDIVAYTTDRPSPKKKKPPRCHAMLYVGDNLKDGHAQMLHIAGGGADVATALGRTNGGLKKSMFDGLLHGRNKNCLQDRTKVVVLRPLALPAAK